MALLIRFNDSNYVAQTLYLLVFDDSNTKLTPNPVAMTESQPGSGQFSANVTEITTPALGNLYWCQVLDATQVDVVFDGWVNDYYAIVNEPSVKQAAPVDVDAIADAVLREIVADHVGVTGSLAFVVNDIQGDTKDLYTNQGNWLTATGFATPTDVSDSTNEIKVHGDANWASAGFTIQDIWNEVQTATAWAPDSFGFFLDKRISEIAFDPSSPAMIYTPQIRADLLQLYQGDAYDGTAWQELSWETGRNDLGDITVWRFAIVDACGQVLLDETDTTNVGIRFSGSVAYVSLKSPATAGLTIADDHDFSLTGEFAAGSSATLAGGTCEVYKSVSYQIQQ